MVTTLKMEEYLGRRKWKLQLKVEKKKKKVET